MNEPAQPSSERDERPRGVFVAAALLAVLSIVIVVVALTSGDESASPTGPDAEGRLGNSESSVDSAESTATTATPPTSTNPPTSSSAAAPTTPDAEPETTSTEPPLLSTATILAPPNTGDQVSSFSSIAEALLRLEPGGTIEFEPGIYPPLAIAGVQGERGNPVEFIGGPGVEFRGSSYDADAGILIQDSAHVVISGMQVSGSLWGILLENSTDVIIRRNNVTDIGQEAIRVKDGSSNIVIDENSISDTGRRTSNGIPNGEGIYIGTGTPGGVDLVTDVVISNNLIDRTNDEAIDIKLPSSNISIVGNTITNVVTHTSGAIVVHLNNEEDTDPNITIERNILRNVTRSSEFRDGNCIVAQTTVRIVNNVLHDCQHRGIYLRGSAGLATILHNTLVSPGVDGAIVDEGLGIEMISMNNLGAQGEDNLAATLDDFVAANEGDYRLALSVAEQFDSAEPLGVVDDLFGQFRGSGENVTYGAVEAG